MTVTVSNTPRPAWASAGRWYRIAVTDGAQVLARVCCLSARDRTALVARYTTCSTWAEVEAVS